jgi:hypothetical protein
MSLLRVSQTCSLAPHVSGGGTDANDRSLPAIQLASIGR